MAAGRKKAGPGVHIAGEAEVLEHLTSVLRGDEAGEEHITPRDRLRAAELLAKRYNALTEPPPTAAVPRIIDDIPQNTKEET